MNEQDVMVMLKNQRRYKAEIIIMRDCSDQLSDIDSSDSSHRCALLNRRLKLINQWLYMLPGEERVVVQQHLIEGWTWVRIATEFERENNNEIPCDIRTLQRAQTRALKRLVDFTNASFRTSLDFLVDPSIEIPVEET